MSIYLHKVKSRWQPGENTLLYLPLKSDINDASGNSRPTTSSGITFTTVGGVQTAHNSTSGYIQSTNQDFITSGMTEQTISCWFYVTSAQTSTRRFLLQFKKTSVYYDIIMIEANTNQIKVLNNGSWGGSGITVTANQWNNVVMTADNSTRKVYMNGSFIWSGATNSAWQPTSETNETGDFIMGGPYHSESLNGNMGDMIIEDKARTAEEIEDYYMLTKGDYYTESQWEVNGHTLSYFPLKTDSDDVIGTRSLTLSGTTISDGVANISAATSYMLLSNTIGGTNMTASLWYYPTAFNSSNWNTIFARNGGAYHHLLISGGNSDEGTVGKVGFWNNSWTGSSAVLDINKWYNIIITKSGTNEKIYVNGALVLDSNSSFDNAAYQLGIIANHTNSTPSQGAQGKISEVIFEDKARSADEVLSYYYQTRNNYVDDPWYPTKEYEVENIYIGDIGWQPGENTIAYLPLKGDLTDKVGNYTWTSGANLSFDTSVANIPVAYMTYDNGYAYTTTNGPSISGSNSYTMSGWVKQTSATGSMCLFNSGSDVSGGTYQYKGMKFYKFYEGGSYKSYFAMYLGGYSGSSGFERLYNYNPGTNWHLWTCTYTPGTRNIYLDGTQVATASGTLSGSVTPLNPMTIGVARADGWSSPTAYYSDIIFESKARTAEEIQAYYNLTKSNYGL